MVGFRMIALQPPTVKVKSAGGYVGFMPSVLCIAGLDPSGYSGLSADFRALQFLGVHCLPIASTLTVQNSKAFTEHLPAPAEFIVRQLDTVLECETPGAIKLGMLGSHELAKILAEYLSDIRIPIITDPIFMTSTGASVIDDEIMDAYIHDIFPVSHMVTPNAPEAEILTGLKADDPEMAEDVCNIIMDSGPGAVLLKGGHFKVSIGTDVFCDSSGCQIIPGKHIDVKVRGTGCAYSSLIAGNLSIGMDTLDAVRKAKLDMTLALSQAKVDGSPYLRFHTRSDVSSGKITNFGLNKHENSGGPE